MPIQIIISNLARKVILPIHKDISGGQRSVSDERFRDWETGQI